MNKFENDKSGKSGFALRSVFFLRASGGYPTRLASVDGIRAKYGKRSVTRASLMNCGAAASRGIGFSGE